MTEAEWLACTDPQMMLHFMRGKASDRKLRLFAVACVAHICPLLASPLAVEAVEAAERFVDGLAPAEELQGMRGRLMDSIDVAVRQWRASRDAGEAEQPHARRDYEALALPYQVTWPEAGFAADYASSKACDVYAALVNPGAASCDKEYRNSKLEETRNQANLLRDIFEPFHFRFPPPIDRAWLAWQDGTIPKLAASIYEERQLSSGHLDPVRLAILADALEEAGCTDEAILSHLRGPGPHCRGCWVVDRLLGKE